MFYLATAIIFFIILYYRFNNKEKVILICGMESSGKRTMLFGIQGWNKRVASLSTGELPSDDKILTVYNTKFILYSSSYIEKEITKIDGIIFMFDLTNQKQFEDAISELKYTVETYPNAPLLIIGNKMDVDGAISKAEFKNYINRMEINAKVSVISVKDYFYGGLDQRELGKELQDGFEFLGVQKKIVGYQRWVWKRR